MRNTFFLMGAALLLAASTVSAQGHMGQWGFGQMGSDMPVAISRGINDQTVITFGIDFDKFDVPENSGQLETSFTVGARLNFDLVQHTGSAVGFGLAPAVMFTSQSPEGDGDSASEFSLHAMLGGHWDPMSWLSFWAYHGLAIDIFSPPVGDSTTDFGLTGVGGVGNFGWTFWW